MNLKSHSGHNPVFSDVENTRQIKMQQSNLNNENTACDPTAMADSFNLLAQH